MNADKVRELASRGEGPTLDYKRDDYDWADKSKSNAELAKDIMAIANGLQRGAEPGYILIGVDDNGNIVGIPTNAHLDDASLQQKVSAHLNRTPTFLYTPVDVDGQSVGVYEIKPGGRPFFPLKASGNLQKHIALHRGGGTSAAVASPEVILGWAREDNAEEHELRLHQVQSAKANATPRPRLVQQTRHNSDSVSLTIKLENNGASGFTVERATFGLRLSEHFLRDHPGFKFPDEYKPMNGDIPNLVGTYIGARLFHHFYFTATRQMGAKHTSEFGSGGWKPEWGDLEFEVEVRSDSSDITARAVLKLPY